MRSDRTAGQRSAFLWLAAAVALACAVYVNALHNPFVYDDHDTVVANPSLTDPANLRFVLVYAPFRPVVNVSYAIDRAVWGGAPFGYHLTNLLLHAIVAGLLYSLLLRALGDAGVATARELAAFSGAAVFAVHPIQTESVGYVSGRSEVMCALWVLAAMLLARRAVVARDRVAGVAALVCGMLAFASKETAAALPITVLAYDWLLRPGGSGGGDARRRRLWVVHAPIFAMLAAGALYRLAVLRAAPNGDNGALPLLNLWTQGIVIWRYLAMLAWPAGQSIMHAFHRVVTVADPLACAAAAGLVAIAAAAWRVRRGAPLVTLGVLWFFAALAPSSSVVALREGMAEHRVYLPAAGLMFCVAAAVAHVAGAMTAGRRRTPRGPLVAVLVVVAVLSVLTVRRNGVWGSAVSVWADAAPHAGGMWEPHYALADALRESGDCAAAIPEYRRVVESRPAHRDAHTNLGICLAQSGQLDEAERSLRRALEIDPAFARGYTNLGALAIVAGDPGRALDFYREALAQDPQNVLARMQLASLYERTMHDYRAAVRMCGEARAIAPATPGVVECVERNERLAAARDAGR